MQTISIIKKTKDLTAVYYKTDKGLIIDNGNGDISFVGNYDSYIGVNSLANALKLINWSDDAKTTVEHISWLPVGAK